MNKPDADILPISLLLFTVVFAAWIGVAGPLVSEVAWVPFGEFVSRYQTLIGAIIAVTGIWAASRNVTRQLRQEVLAREEDRIERDLPGIRSANSLIGQLKWQLEDKVGPILILKSLREQGLIPLEPSAKIDLAKTIPDLPDQIRRELTTVLHLLRSAAVNLVDYTEVVKRTANGTADPELLARMQENQRHAAANYSSCCDDLNGFYDSTVQRIVRDRARLHYLRSEHEKWLRF
jgi:hypothetical protein